MQENSNQNMSSTMELISIFHLAATCLPIKNIPIMFFRALINAFMDSLPSSMG